MGAEPGTFGTDCFLVCSIPLRQTSKSLHGVSSDGFDPYSAAERKINNGVRGVGMAEQAHLRLPRDPDHLDP